MTNRPLVIAHRGASGYLPEHTLAAKALAYGQGADYLEQDVVATRDDQLIVLHDIHLDTVTDVADRFPDRHRDDGRWYARDFDLAEIRELRAFERSLPDGSAAVYPGRFPHRRGRFSVPTLEDEIELILGLNRATGRQVGLYPEIKQPAWHRGEGVDLAARLLQVLSGYGLQSPEDAVFLQCFDAEETRRLREQFGTGLRIVQLIGDDAWDEAETDYAKLLTPDGLADVATYADGIGPWLPQLYRTEGPSGDLVTSGVVEQARAQGLAVHPYTFRADDLAPGFDDFENQVRWFARTLRIDGMFTDFPDRTLRALSSEAG
ncbi:MAG: glycerophosphodiester phosphodiesterase [Woeseiaceae bacterium]|nr:glycerophosphodiester phosphodiesterase [Woeseiaceae bacterium]